MPISTKSPSGRVTVAPAPASISNYMKNICFSLLAGLLVAGAGSTARAEDGWINLFNGTNLDGWVEHSGQAKYTVENGELIGETVSASGNSFLCTTRTYANFELELDFLCDPLLNSGVQIRSDVFPESRTLHLKDKTVKLTPDRIHGYQCEIDMDKARGRMWTGGIFDEARRGWLFPADGEKGPQGRAFSAQGNAVSKPGVWNHLRIVAEGDSIKTWLNGVQRSELTDNLTPIGLIGLQVHGIGKDEKKIGLHIHFRNIRLREINNTISEQEKKEGWRLLWDGQTTDGWRSPKTDAFPSHGWFIHDGVLTVHENGGNESAGGGDIITRDRYANFELTAEFRRTAGCNSGIKIFVQPDLSPITKTGGKAAVGSAIGMEFQILDDDLHPDAKLGQNGDRKLGSLYDLIPAPADKVVWPIGQWNHARIVSQGKHVEFWLNGAKTVEFERGSDAFRAAVAASKYKNIPGFGEWADGHILLQEHGSEVSFRNVKIRELPAN